MVNFSASKCEVKRGQSHNPPISALGPNLHKEHQIAEVIFAKTAVYLTNKNFFNIIKIIPRHWDQFKLTGVKYGFWIYSGC